MTTQVDRKRIIREAIGILRSKDWSDMKIHTAIRITYDGIDEIPKKRGRKN